MADIMKTFIKHMDGQHKAAVADAAAKAMAEHCDARITKMCAALELALPYLDNGDSPGGCDGRQKNCGHCAAIRAVRSALKE